MRLLILTQMVDQQDPTLGFFHQWIEEFARHSKAVQVVCLFEGSHSLPPHVTMLSLGKEKGHSRLRCLCRFFLYIWKYRRDHDAVFVHMNQRYVLLGGPLWRLWGKRVCLWYAHGTVSFSLWLAERLAHAIVTSSREGFRLASDKVHIVGQGIDVKKFVQCASGYRPEHIRILYVGRISPVKHCEVLIEAAALLHARGERLIVTLVGDVGAPGAGAYYALLEARIRALNIAERVTFVGGVPHTEVARYLCASDVFVSPSQTGSLDKAGLEAIAAGVPVITCNEAFADVFGHYADRLMFPKGDARALSERIIALHRADDRMALTNTLAEKVSREHSLETLIPRILGILSTT